ncbi:uncharacterized protein RHO25_002655 [Cercospora beticola]|uniref:Concanavalin A-like lectin/glucanase n=2 Tax=Cercospora beticola TaxID=122368 RepID=A0ABZ0NER8_CERBT|nr:hypothetical protein RHO25_002655 [Cercospora beticola]
MTRFVFAVAAALAVGKVASEVSLCGQFETHTEWPYTINNNAWDKDDESGSICTYACEDCRDAISFYSVWNWTTQDPVRVHAYPHVELRSERLPLQLGELRTLKIAASWSLAPVSLIDGTSQDPTTEPVAGALEDNDVQANVVLDVFADADVEKSRTPAQQTYELMVWVGVFGNASWPIGMNEPRDPPVIMSLDDIDFTLYNGTNSRGQLVYSWVADQTSPTFDLDFAPLLNYLQRREGIPEDVYVGTVQFGSETFYSDSPMNFSVSSFEAEVERGTPAADSDSDPESVGNMLGVPEFGMGQNGFIALCCLLVAYVMVS